MLLNIDFFKSVFFINIGRYQHDDNYFEWTSSTNPKSTFFEIKGARNAPFTDIFFCINKPNIKLVYYVKDETVFTMGASPEVQSLLLETLLEYLIEQFFKTYDSTMLLSCYGDTCHIFNGFSSVIREAFNNFNSLNLYKTALVHCKGCKKTITIVIKKSMVENSEKPTIPIVYAHSGHAVLVYIDKQYKVRGNELVTLSY
ncbi:MAG: hypothetical protein ACTSR8_01510 [Promethearchaeota archaeon]